MIADGEFGEETYARHYDGFQYGSPVESPKPVGGFTQTTIFDRRSSSLGSPTLSADEQMALEERSEGSLSDTGSTTRCYSCTPVPSRPFSMVVNYCDRGMCIHFSNLILCTE